MIKESFTLSDGRSCLVSVFAMAELDQVMQIENDVSLLPWSRQNFIDSVESSHLCLGTYIEGQLIAYSVFSVVADQAELLLIGVDKKHQGLKVASQFLQLVEKALSARVSEIFLEVRVSNQAAIGLYENLGFNCVGNRKNYYPTPVADGGREDALIYAKHVFNN